MQTKEWTFKSQDGLELYARYWAPDKKAKAVACLVHGLGEHTGRYAHVADAMTAAGYALAGFDLRGHGKSGGKRGDASATDMLADIERFLQQVDGQFPGLPRFLYGHSLGGILVLYYTPTRKPSVVGVISTAPAMHSSIEEQKAKKLMAQVLGSLAPRMTIDTGLIPATLSHDPVVVKEYVEDPLVHHVMSLGFGKSMMALIPQVFTLAPQFPVPVLVMHGELDALGYPSGSQKFASLVPKDCTFKIWTGMLHEIHNESDRAQVFAVMTSWMDGQLKNKK